MKPCVCAFLSRGNVFSLLSLFIFVVTERVGVFIHAKNISELWRLVVTEPRTQQSSVISEGLQHACRGCSSSTAASCQIFDFIVVLRANAKANVPSGSAEATELQRRRPFSVGGLSQSTMISIFYTVPCMKHFKDAFNSSCPQICSVSERSR